MSNGNGGGGFDFGGIFDGLLAGLFAVINAIISFLIALVNVLVEILNFLFQGELGIFGFSAHGLTEIWKGLKNLVDQVLKVWVVKVIKHLLDLYQKLQEWIRKLKAWIDRFRKLQQLYQVQALRRIINLIQRVRRILLIFRLLHIGFATRLDNWLAGIEGKLIQHQAQFTAKTNMIIGWLNLVLDPVAFFRSLPLLRGLGGALGDVLGGFNRGFMQSLFPSSFGAVGSGVQTGVWQDVLDQFHQEKVDSSGDYGDFKKQVAFYRKLLDDGFGTTPALRS